MDCVPSPRPGEDSGAHDLSGCLEAPQVGVSLGRSHRGDGGGSPCVLRGGQPSANVFLYFARESVRSVPQSRVVSQG